MTDVNGNAPAAEAGEKKVSYLVQCNHLIKELTAEGMPGLKEISASSKPGAAQLASLQSRARAWRSGQAAMDRQQGPEVQPDQVKDDQVQSEEASVPASVRKSKSATKAKTKVAAKAATKKAKSKAKASQNARTKVKEPQEKRPGFVGDFETRKGTFKDDLIQILEKASGPIKLTKLAEKLYANGKGKQGKKVKNDGKSALTMVLVGVKDFITRKKLKYELIREGRGDDATIALVKK